MLSVRSNDSSAYPALGYSRRGERQSPLLGGEGWVRTVVKLSFAGGHKDGHVQGLGNGGAMKPGAELFCFDARPHLCPLPRGEDFSSHAFGGLNDCRTIQRSVFPRMRGMAKPSPRRRGLGEDGR